MSLFARGISSRLTNAIPFGSAVASRESRYCRVVWFMSFLSMLWFMGRFIYSTVCQTSSCGIRWRREMRPYGCQPVLSAFSTPSRQASWVFFAVVCFASLVSLSLMADVVEILNQAGTARHRARHLGLFARGVVARLAIRRYGAWVVRLSILSAWTRCCRGRFSQPWLRAWRPSPQYRFVPLCAAFRHVVEIFVSRLRYASCSS